MRRTLIAVALVAAALASSLVHAQGQGQIPGLWLPNASPTAKVSQTLGVTAIDLVYHRPAVNERDVWGALVPYGQVWRTGANENTTIAFSTDVTVEGEPLPAGVYGLHTLPAEGEWEVIFSHDTTAWGSFSYNEENDALRVKVQPQAAEHQERMQFAFDEVGADSAVLALSWAALRVPISIGVDLQATTLASIREQLKGLSQFSWQGWAQAANWCNQNEVNLEEAVQWADRSIGVEDRFENQSAKSQLLAKLGDEEGSKAAMDLALGKANAGQLHNYGRQLIGQDQKQEALAVFKRNAEQNPEAWFIGVGLARGYSAVGDFANAAKGMEDAIGKAPAGQEAYLGGLLTRLKNGEDIN